MKFEITNFNIVSLRSKLMMFNGLNLMSLFKEYRNLGQPSSHITTAYNAEYHPYYKNIIFKFNRWSRIDVALNYFNHKDITQYERVLQEHIIDAMKPIRVGKKLYRPEILVRALDYFATSRCTYEKLRHDYKLPSVKTMSNLTSKEINRRSFFVPQRWAAKTMCSTGWWGIC